MDRENTWSRRTGNKPSFSKAESQSRGFGSSKRYASGDATSRSNGLSTITTAAVASPGASSAFGLGSGAFAAFGSTSKTPKTPGAAFDFGKNSYATTPPPSDVDVGGKLTARSASPSASKDSASSLSDAKTWPLKYTWVMWYRPPATSKSQDYEKSIKPVYTMRSAQEFWKVYAHLKRPSMLPIVSDYHFFKDSIRPVWEDEANKKGGKWIMRFKKGVMDRYWDELLLAIIGDQFIEASDEVCGMVVSVRNGEDVLSVWTKNDGGRNVKIRETIKRILALPTDTTIIWKSHDDSIAQKSAVEQARQDKGEKRRNTLHEHSAEGQEKEKEKTAAS